MQVALAKSMENPESGFPRVGKSFIVDLKKGTTVTFEVELKMKSPTIGDLTFRSKGGFTKAGEVFVAGEKGAELVGKINGRTAVANQSEIGDAIFQYMEATHGGMNEEKLAGAIVSGMRSAGIGAVYLDGKRLASAINRETKRTGRPAITF